MVKILTNVAGFQIPPNAVVKFEGPQQSWGWGSDSVGRAVSRSYGRGKVCVPFRELLTNIEGRLHWWGNRQCSQILDVTSITEVTVEFLILDAQCVQYAHYWSINHHFYRWQVGKFEITKSQTFLSDPQGRPIPGTNYGSSSYPELTLAEHEAALTNA
jgi:hypothetical protein